MYPRSNFRQEHSSPDQLGQQCVCGGARVLKEVLEASETSNDLRWDTQGAPRSPRNVPVVSGVVQQGQVLDRVVVERLNTVTWTE